MKNSYIYIMANKKDGVLYVGVTSDLIKRVYEHKNSVVDAFTSKYNLKQLVYYEVHNEMTEAIKREKQLKNWKRAWKIELIEKNNAEWLDLYPGLVASGS